MRPSTARKFLQSFVDPQPSAAAVSRAQNFVQYWRQIENEVGADYLEALSDDAFDALLTEVELQLGVRNSDESLTALLSVIPQTAGFGRHEHC